MIIKLGAEWCNPCKNLQKEIEANGFSSEVLSIDVDSSKGIELCNKYGVRGVPALIINGAVLSGKDCTVEAIRNALQDSGL